MLQASFQVDQLMIVQWSLVLFNNFSDYKEFTVLVMTLIPDKHRCVCGFSGMNYVNVKCLFDGHYFECMQ